MKLVNAVFEDHLAAFVDDTVHDACKGEAATDDGAHANQELQEVFAHIRVLYGERRHLVIENDQALVALKLRLTRCSQLEYFVLVKKLRAENVVNPGAELSEEDGWHSFEVKSNSHCFLIARQLALKSIKWVHHASIWEVSCDSFKVSLLAKRQMVDPERVVESVAFHR